MGFGPILFRTCLKGQKEITVAAYSHKIEGSCEGLEIYSGFIEAMTVSACQGPGGPCTVSQNWNRSTKLVQQYLKVHYEHSFATHTYRVYRAAGERLGMQHNLCRCLYCIYVGFQESKDETEVYHWASWVSSQSSQSSQGRLPSECQP